MKLFVACDGPTPPKRYHLYDDCRYAAGCATEVTLASLAMFGVGEQDCCKVCRKRWMAEHGEDPVSEGDKPTGKELKSHAAAQMMDAAVDVFEKMGVTGIKIGKTTYTRKK